jgi:ribosomal protein S18 acetylase RimI-like enzyme
MEILKAKSSDVPEIIELTRSCARYMISIGIFQWNEYYPSETVFYNDVELDQLWKIVSKGEILGIMVLTEIEDDEYDGVSWLTDNVKNLYIHRLAVHPKHQGKGVARKLLDFSETFAQNNKYASIRLDTFSQNKRNQKIYEQRGYVKLEDIYFPKQSEHPFHCYEKLLNA